MICKETFARLALATIAAACFVSQPASGQDDAMTPIANPAQSDAVVLGTGSVQGWSARRASGSIMREDAVNCPVAVTGAGI